MDLINGMLMLVVLILTCLTFYTEYQTRKELKELDFILTRIEKNLGIKSEKGQ